MISFLILVYLIVVICLLLTALTSADTIKESMKDTEFPKEGIRFWLYVIFIAFLWLPILFFGTILKLMGILGNWVTK